MLLTALLPAQCRPPHPALLEPSVGAVHEYELWEVSCHSCNVTLGKNAVTRLRNAL